MKKSVLSIVLVFAMVLALFGGAISVHAAPTEVFTDDFSDGTLAGKYTVAGNTASVVDGKMVIDSTAGDFGGALIAAQKVGSFVLEFDVNNACAAPNLFSVITGIQDRMALTLQDWVNSSIAFGAGDSVLVGGGRYSWATIPANTDVRVRVTVDTGVFKIEYQAVGAADWTVIEDHAAGTLSLQPTEGYVALAINGAGKATIDNVSLIAEYAPEDPLPTEPEVTEPEVTEPEVTEPEVTEPAPTTPTVPEGEFYWEDNFDGRTELGDMYINTGNVSIVDGKLKFDKIADATGVFIQTQPMGNKFTVSFDMNMQEGSSPAAFLFGMDSGDPVMYWDGSVNRFSMAMDAYRMGCIGEEFFYVPGSGTDTDAATAYQAGWFQAHCTPVNKAEDEYLNVRLVFDVVDGENVVTVYYKLNTDPDSELEKARVMWKGVDAAGRIGIVSQGAGANFTIDNLVITDREEAPEQGGEQPPVTGDNLPAVLMAMALVTLIAVPVIRRRNEK